MSRYKQLTISKREFVEELIRLDGKHNFLTAPEYSAFLDMLNEGRYLSEESEWINKIIGNHKSTYKKLKKEE